MTEEKKYRKRSPGARAKRHLSSLNRRRDFLKLITGNGERPGLSYDKRELSALNWAIAKLNELKEK